MPIDWLQIQLADDVHHEACQVILWQHLAHLDRLVQHPFVIWFLKLSAHHSSLPLTIPSGVRTSRWGLATFPLVQTGRETFASSGFPVLASGNVLSWFVL